jgi:ABC-type lipoprotein release transport system permease subunit
VGIDPPSPANQPFQSGVLAGQYLTANDSTGLLIGKSLADKLGLSAGDTTTLLVNTSDGSVVQQNFTIRGIYATNTPSYDETTVFLPLAKAQAITQAGDHASLIFILLKDTNQSAAVVQALQSSEYKTLTFADMNPLLMSIEDLSNSFMIILYLIVLGVTATVIVNTLVMSVFERTREIGILAALGMRGGRIMSMFFAESCLLAFGGIAIGLAIGIPLVTWLGEVGIPIPNIGTTAFLIGRRIYTNLSLQDGVTLSVLALMVSLLAALYPARLASRMEPVEALHSAQ